MVLPLSGEFRTASLQELLDQTSSTKTNIAVHGCESPSQLGAGSHRRIPSALSATLTVMNELHFPTGKGLELTVARLEASPAVFSHADESQSGRDELTRQVEGIPGRVDAPGDLFRYLEHSKSSTGRRMHGAATELSKPGRLFRILHGGE